ncbi:hypothetical protein E0703_06070, partial [Lactobacillus helveticus]|nr:hypothetical protein [Lactobacillus helveticus]
FTPPEVHARGYIAIISSLIEYLLAKLLSFQGFIVPFGVGSLSNVRENTLHYLIRKKLANFFRNSYLYLENTIFT